MAGNEALDINPADVGIGITTHGSDWYWAVFSLFALTSLVHSFISAFNFRKGTKGRAYLHVGPLCSTAVMAYAYFTMASNLGWTDVPTEFNHIEIGDNTRQVFYARYIGWFLAFPPLLYHFELNAQAHHVLTDFNFWGIFHNLVLQVCATEVFVLGLLIGSLIESSYKWGYWTFAIVAQLFALTLIVYRQAFSDYKATSFPNILVVSFFSLSFLLYPVCWGLSEGGNVIQPDSEGVFYGVLDLILFWIIPFVTVFDSVKNGTFVEAAATAPVANDVEKQVESPDLRASGETEVPVVQTVA